MKVDNTAKKKQFRILIKDMDLPEFTSSRWFIDNGAVANASHPNFQAALTLAKQITGYGSFDDNERYFR